MGVSMDGQSGKRGIWWLVLAFIGLPVFFYGIGDVPRRTVLKESISILVILAFSLTLAQFFLSRFNRKLLGGYTMGRIITIHKVIGYTFLGVLLVHPFLLVLPRYYEAGVDSMDALVTIITTVNSMGVAFGICAWLFMLLLGLTSLFRHKLPLSYKNWRLLHGLLAVPFIVLAACHSINLGRHVHLFLTVYFILFAVSGVILLIKTYLTSPALEQGTAR